MEGYRAQDERRWTIQSSEDFMSYNGGDGNAIVIGPAVNEEVEVVPASLLEGAVERIKALHGNAQSGRIRDDRDAAYSHGYSAGVRDALEALIGGRSEASAASPSEQRP